LAGIFIIGIAAERRPLSGFEGCGYTCDELHYDECDYVGIPEEGCNQVVWQACETNLESYGPDCERACQVVDASCTDDPQCVGSGYFQVECIYDDRAN
jgi:hypothetical protein